MYPLFCQIFGFFSSWIRIKELPQNADPDQHHWNLLPVLN